MLGVVLLGASSVCAIWPAVLFTVNLRRYRAPAPTDSRQRFAVSVLIPARNEEANIAQALRCVLASQDIDLELLVLDDASGDRTAEIVREAAVADPRVRLLEGQGLPSGWNGKQYACWTLANQASRRYLVFLDADVRIEPELLARIAEFRFQHEAALVSGFPRLVTVTWLEKLLLPLIHFVLLGFLPLGAMRKTTSPSTAAGCGQFMFVERDAYFRSGGHHAIRETMHDGLLLPRVLRRAGYATDLADITGLASVRMYDSAAKVWSGLAKNATEGIATAGKIIPLTLILLLGQVVPAFLALYLVVVVPLLFLNGVTGATPSNTLLQAGVPFLSSVFTLAHGGTRVHIAPLSIFTIALGLLFVTVLCNFLPRLLAVRRFRQPLGSALLHPVGILVLLVLQWYALARKLFGKPVGWRQRTYSSATGTEVG